MLKHQKVNQDPELTDRLVRKQMRQQLRKAIKAETNDVKRKELEKKLKAY